MKLLCASRAFPILILAILAFGCNQSGTDSSSQQTASSRTAPQLPLTIQPGNSPAGRDSREPELSTTSDGRIILSWVEKIGNKRYALRFATRDANNWSTVRTVAEGENWFINWADFPSVIALAKL